MGRSIESDKRRTSIPICHMIFFTRSSGSGTFVFFTRVSKDSGKNKSGAKRNREVKRL
jgi:hypothetical protein